MLTHHSDPRTGSGSAQHFRHRNLVNPAAQGVIRRTGPPSEPRVASCPATTAGVAIRFSTAARNHNDDRRRSPTPWVELDSGRLPVSVVVAPVGVERRRHSGQTRVPGECLADQPPASAVRSNVGQTPTYASGPVDSPDSTATIGQGAAGSVRKCPPGRTKPVPSRPSPTRRCCRTCGIAPTGFGSKPVSPSGGRTAAVVSFGRAGSGPSRLAPDGWLGASPHQKGDDRPARAAGAIRPASASGTYPKPRPRPRALR